MKEFRQCRIWLFPQSNQNRKNSGLDVLYMHANQNQTFICSTVNIEIYYSPSLNLYVEKVLNWTVLITVDGQSLPVSLKGCRGLIKFKHRGVGNWWWHCNKLRT